MTKNRAELIGGIKRMALDAAAILACFLVIGEIVFRMPFVPGLLRYEFDESLGWRLAPSQRGCLFLGGMSYLSPPIGINGDGFRNGPLDWKAPMVLCLGSSESLGAGVEDGEVWTSQLTALTGDGGMGGAVAVNASGPGYGPYQSRIVLERFLQKKRPEMAVVRVSLGDRNFLPPTPKELADLKDKEKTKRIVHSLSAFLPFLVNKIEAQKISIAGVFAAGASEVYSRGNETAEIGGQMWDRHREHWRAMAERCGRDSVPLIFLIDDPLDTEAGRSLQSRFEEAFAGAGKTQVMRLDGTSFGLAGSTPDERRAEYRERFTLLNDPHANAVKHSLLARYIFRDPRFRR